MKTQLKHLKLLLEHMKYYNWLAPFPVFDTDYVKEVEIKIKKMENNEKINYDEDPVEACRYCLNLHLLPDEDSNIICTRCESRNELVTYNTIFDYLEAKKKRDE